MPSHTQESLPASTITILSMVCACALLLVLTSHSVFGDSRIRISACKSKSPPCYCEIEWVTCVGKGLARIPVTPTQIGSLVLSENSIQRVEEKDLEGQETLNRLLLDNNGIVYIHSRAFRHLYKLEILNLMGNNFRRLDPSGLMFQHLSSLVTLFLQRCHIETLNRYSFITTWANVDLADNVISCDCEVQSMKQWIDEMRFVGEFSLDLNYECVNERVLGNCPSPRSSQQRRGKQISGNMKRAHSTRQKRTGDRRDPSPGSPKLGSGKPDDSPGRRMGKRGKGKQNPGDGGDYGDERRQEDNDYDYEDDDYAETWKGYDEEEWERRRRIDEKTLYTFSSRVNCHSCNNERTNYACKQKKIMKCGISEVCERRIKWTPYSSSERNLSMSITSGCTDYAQCVISERGTNGRTCGLNYRPKTSPIECVFCCFGDTCENDTIGGRTVDFRLSMVYFVRDTGPFERNLNNRGSSKFWKRQTEIQEGLRKDFTNLIGGLTVLVKEYTWINEGRLKVSLQLEVTVFNNETKDTVLSSMRSDIKDSLTRSDKSGYLKNVGVYEDAVFIGESISGNGQCPSEIVRSSKGYFVWPDTPKNKESVLPCPYQGSSSKDVAKARRYCKLLEFDIVEWQDQIDTDCHGPFDQLRKKLPVTKDNAKTIVNELKESLRDNDLDPNEVNQVVGFLEKLTSKSGEALKVPGVSEDVVDVINTLLDTELEQLAEAQANDQSSQRLLSVIDNVAEGTPLTNGQLKIVSPNVAIAAQGLAPGEKRDIKFVSKSYALIDSQVNVDFTGSTNSSSRSDGTNVVFPTASLLTSVPANLRSGVDRVAFSVFKSGKLFQTMGSSESDETENPQPMRTKINSQVVSVLVPGVRSYLKLQDNVTLTFPHDEQVCLMFLNLFQQ